MIGPGPNRREQFDDSSQRRADLGSHFVGLIFDLVLASGLAPFADGPNSPIRPLRAQLGTVW